MKDELVFAGKSLSEFNVYCDLSKTFNTPEKDYEFVEILGRNGELAISNDRFKTINISIPCFIRTGFLKNYQSLIEYLESIRGYQALETSKEPGHFRKALFMNVVEPQTTPFNQGGLFTLNFKCKPQRWLKSGEEPKSISSGQLLENPTSFPSKPIIRIYGTGTVNINDDYIKVSTHPFPYIDIDCELMDAHYELNNANTYVEFSGVDSITLQSGTNQFEYSVQSIEVTPRWYRI